MTIDLVGDLSFKCGTCGEERVQYYYHPQDNKLCACERKEKLIAKLIALRQAIHDPNSTVELKQIFSIIIDALLATLKN